MHKGRDRESTRFRRGVGGWLGGGAGLERLRGGRRARGNNALARVRFTRTCGGQIVDPTAVPGPTVLDPSAEALSQLYVVQTKLLVDRTRKRATYKDGAHAVAGARRDREDRDADAARQLVCP